MEFTSTWAGPAPVLVARRRTGQIDLTPGVPIRLTEAYFRAIEKVGGSRIEWLKTWRVQGCECLLCRSGKFVAVNEESVIFVGPRHLQVSNLENPALAADEQHELAAE